MNDNPEPSAKLVRKVHNINAEVNKACDVTVTQMKHCFKEASHTTLCSD
jgi:hypothetical protein